MDAISVRGLTKVFRAKQKQPGMRGSLRALVKPEWSERAALHPLDLDVQIGEMLAFVGPNGAGKSTTIKMLTGILHPSSGEASVLGLCPWKERKELAFQIGCVFGQKSQLWIHLPAMDTFHLMARIYELDDATFTRRRDWLIDVFALGPYVSTPVRKLSLGERMRCEIAASLLHKPQILFLDEPTIGLDVIAKQQIRSLIQELNREEEVTVFLTSHDAGDIEQLCRRVIVIDHGRLVIDRTLQEMKRDFLRYKTIHLRFQEPQTVVELPHVNIIEQSAMSAKLEVDIGRQSMESVLAHIVAHHRIADVTIEDPSMEEIIRHVYTSGVGGGSRIANAGK